MPTLDEQQDATAAELLRQIIGLQPDQSALWQLNGAVGSGKTTVLRRVAEQLRLEEWIPLTIAAPAGEIDSAPIALLETASQLKSSGLLNGEMSVISDPTRRWREKMTAITEAIDKNHDRVVILCDEPTRWYHFDESLLDDSPDYFARSLAEWIVNGARCRRIVTGWIPNDHPADRIWVPRLQDGRDLLESEADWGMLSGYASRLRNSLREPVPDRSAWEMKLCVAMSTLVSAGEAAQLSMSEASANVMLEQFFDEAEQRPDYNDFCATLARLALARTDLNESILEEFTSGLEPPKRGLLDKCLFDWNRGRAALHPLVRHEVFTRARDPQRAKPNSPWRLSKASRMAVHDRLKSEYRLEENAPLRDFVESLHHELLGTTHHPFDLDERLKFIEQLDEIGRALSYLHHEHRRAAELFRVAVQLDPEHAYSHHYLAFNLDWLAEKANEVEDHYKKAIELQPTHPWWWSRWISYLATCGRFREAKFSWRKAVDALSLSEDGSPDWIFLSLHRWVARWLLHWAELDFAEEVLRSIPRRLTENDASIQTLWDLLRALRQAERGISVFPLTVPSSQWWSPGAHTDLPPSWEGHPLRCWIPAKVEGVDREDLVAFLVAAKRPAARDTDPEYFEIELSRSEVLQAAQDFHWDDLREGEFVELGYYGEGEARMRIGLHRDKNWNDPHLLPLVPPPDRWYQRAVEGAWADEAERD